MINSISILINGSSSNKFTTSQGLKQGDPASPFLFINVVEGLVGWFHNAEEGNLFRGFSVDDNLTLYLLQFADDKVIFCDGGDNNFWCLKANLWSFELVSGLKINYAKSN